MIINCTTCGREHEKRKHKRQCIICERLEAKERMRAKAIENGTARHLKQSRNEREEEKRLYGSGWAHKLSTTMLRKSLI